MTLHDDKVAFRYLIDGLAEQNKVRRDILEKDYYVTLLLKELSEREIQGHAYFKGGTALYKALKSIRRFSEDIDLTVYVEDCPSQSQAQKRLENATLKYTCLKKGETLENKRASITCEYLYNSMYVIDTDDALQRFGKVKIEATSFTVSEPTEKIEITPYIYDLADETQKRILRERYEVVPFLLETISLERIFIDKVFAAQFYFERKMYGDVAKHIYDLTVLFDNDKIQTFLSNKERVKKIVLYKRKEELNRKGGVDAETMISDFSYFRTIGENKEFLARFKDMQNIYVFNAKDILSESTVIETMIKLRDSFQYTV